MSDYSSFPMCGNDDILSGKDLFPGSDLVNIFNDDDSDEDDETISTTSSFSPSALEELEEEEEEADVSSRVEKEEEKVLAPLHKSLGKAPRLLSLVGEHYQNPKENDSRGKERSDSEWSHEQEEEEEEEGNATPIVVAQKVPYLPRMTKYYKDRIWQILHKKWRLEKIRRNYEKQVTQYFVDYSLLKSSPLPQLSILNYYQPLALSPSIFNYERLTPLLFQGLVTFDISMENESYQRLIVKSRDAVLINICGILRRATMLVEKETEKRKSLNVIGLDPGSVNLGMGGIRFFGLIDLVDEDGNTIKHIPDIEIITMERWDLKRGRVFRPTKSMNTLQEIPLNGHTEESKEMIDWSDSAVQALTRSDWMFEEFQSFMDDEVMLPVLTVENQCDQHKNHRKEGEDDEDQEEGKKKPKAVQNLMTQIQSILIANFQALHHRALWTGAPLKKRIIRLHMRKYGLRSDGSRKRLGRKRKGVEVLKELLFELNTIHSLRWLAFLNLLESKGFKIDDMCDAILLAIDMALDLYEEHLKSLRMNSSDKGEKKLIQEERRKIPRAPIEKRMRDGEPGFTDDQLPDALDCAPPKKRIRRTPQEVAEAKKVAQEKKSLTEKKPKQAKKPSLLQKESSQTNTGGSKGKKEKQKQKEPEKEPEKKRKRKESPEEVSKKKSKYPLLLLDVTTIGDE